MPFDPSKPTNNSPLSSAEMRAQLNGLNDAIGVALSSTSSNSNSVPTLDTPFTNDPPTLADMEVMRAAYNALVLSLRR